jgi:hypothetical protein
LSGCGYCLETRHDFFLQRKFVSTLPGRIQDESSQPISQSRTPSNSGVVPIDVLLDKVGDVAQLLKVAPGPTWHVRDVTMHPNGFAALALKPKLDDEQMNCGLC